MISGTFPEYLSFRRGTPLLSPLKEVALRNFYVTAFRIVGSGSLRGRHSRLDLRYLPARFECRGRRTAAVAVKEVALREFYVTAFRNAGAWSSEGMC